MQVYFNIRGRLGNAIFRYLASAVICINNNGEYKCIEHMKQHMKEINDIDFQNISKLLLNGDNLESPYKSISMTGFYQHDTIYKKYKKQIIEFILNNNHEIITDGVNAGDNNCEKYKMLDILNTPPIFTKRYKNVLHIRLEDFVTHNLYLPVKRIITLFQTRSILDTGDILCIVCKAPTTSFEKNYINELQNFLKKEKNIKTVIESNNTITDYYIMKEATTLICSKSTLSWCAAFFSTIIQTCYMPDYETSINSTCKYPIDKESSFLY
jgi:hypothetical protein